MIKTRKEAEAYRKAAIQASASLDDATASTAPDMFPKMNYNGELIKAGTRINWNGTLKRAAVDLWDTEANNPDIAPTLWEDVAYHNGYRIIPEVITSTLAFNAGEIGYWPVDDSYYKARYDGTVYNPAVYPDSWEKVEV